MRTMMITGAAGGIGTAVVEHFLKRNYRLLLLDVDQQRLATIHADKPQIYRLAVDLAQPDCAAKICSYLEREGLKINVALLNAGIIIPKYLTASSEQEINLQLDVNLRSTILVAKAIAEHMQQHKIKGHIIATVSMAGIIALPGSALYSASKFALRGFLASLNMELKSQQIAVSGLYLSAVDTPLLRFEARNGGSALNFLSRPLNPKTVARLLERLIARPKLELYAPYSESISARIGAAIPWILPYVFPLLLKLGEKGRRQYLKYLQQIGA